MITSVTIENFKCFKHHEVTTSIGLAAQKGYWNLEHDALSDLRNFIKKLAD